MVFFSENTDGKFKIFFLRVTNKTAVFLLIPQRKNGFAFNLFYAAICPPGFFMWYLPRLKPQEIREFQKSRLLILFAVSLYDLAPLDSPDTLCTCILRFIRSNAPCYTVQITQFLKEAGEGFLHTDDTASHLQPVF
ncbi:MAG TPA: hypothetical protein DEF06_00430 [Clostridiales bacterium]|nr:hypothetical protein [Clostridiales bacterium]